MNASGNYSRRITIQDVTGEAPEPAPPGSEKLLRAAMIAIGKARNGSK